MTDKDPDVSTTIKIHVVGDVSVNWYTINRPAEFDEKSPNWKEEFGWEKYIQNSGAFLVQEMLNYILRGSNKSFENRILPRKIEISGYLDWVGSENWLQRHDKLVQCQLQHKFELGIQKKTEKKDGGRAKKQDVYGVKSRSGFYVSESQVGYFDQLPKRLIEKESHASLDANENELLCQYNKAKGKNLSFKNSLREARGEENDQHQKVYHYLLINDDGHYFRDLDAKTLKECMLVDDEEVPRIIEHYDAIFVKIKKPHRRSSLIEILKNAREGGRNKKVPRIIAVVSADDLRDSGLDISKEISWDNTFRDVYSLLMSNKKMLYLIRLTTDLVITFGREGACHINDLNMMRATFDHSMIEGEYGYIPRENEDEKPVDMPDLSTAFFTTLASSVILNNCENLDEPIRVSLSAVRNLCVHGIRKEEDGSGLKTKTGIFVYPSSVIRNAICEPTKVDFFCSHRIRCPREGDSSIFVSQNSKPLFEMAKDVLINGHRSLSGIPISKFSALVSVDNKEIESYRSIFKVLRHYLYDENWKKPLSIAVFGPPGSGKSFGVKQMAKAANIQNQIFLSFNLAQFESLEDLVDAFHIVVNEIQNERFPIVFFDEFDASFNGFSLGWLKYLLAPMQDGQFKDKQQMFTIGRSIFVFAGGTTSSYDDFCPDAHDNNFIVAKGPDFISRLDGHLDIFGPNRVSSELQEDDTYLLRRALLIRSLLKSVTDKGIFHPGPLGGAGTLQIDASVAHAMLKVRNYKHGARSIETIIRMSGLNPKSERFSQSNLPTNKQLRMHLDTESFRKALREYAEDESLFDEKLIMKYSKRC